MKSFFISHHVFIEENKIKLIQEKNTIVAEGICLPVFYENGASSEPTQEIFCNYHIKFGDTDMIRIVNDGFFFEISDKKKIKCLLSIKDGGSEFLSIVMRDTIKGIFVYHQAVLMPLSELDKSMLVCQTSQTAIK